KEEMKMAFALIDMLHEPFDPEKFEDEYRDVLMNMITTKLEGGEVVAADEEAAPAQTVDLMAALRASIEATKSRKSGTASTTGAKASKASKAAESEDAEDDSEDEPEEAPKKKRATSKAAASKSDEKPAAKSTT